MKWALIRLSGYFFAAVIAALLFCVVSAFARDDGRYAQSPHREWVQGLTDRNGQSCCDTADGYDVEWDTQDDKYRVRINGEWLVVPSDAVLDNIPNRLGVARVWYIPSFDKDGKMTPSIRCFLPGSGT